MKKAALILWLLLLPTVVHATTIPEPSTREEFERFWEDYTKALNNTDPNSVLAFVAFPFTSRGAMDFDPEVEYSPDTFTLVLKQLLQSDVGTTELPTPMVEYIGREHSFSDQDILSGEVRVGNFKFHKTKGRWKWYYAYYDLPSMP